MLFLGSDEIHSEDQIDRGTNPLGHYNPNRKKYQLVKDPYFNAAFIPHTHIDLGWVRTINHYYYYSKAYY